MKLSNIFEYVICIPNNITKIKVNAIGLNVGNKLYG